MGERLSERAQIYQKLEGNVVWVPGDTSESYERKADEYLAERFDAIRQGKPTWMRRNFGGGMGAAYDYYRDGHRVGTVIVDEMDCDVVDAQEGPNGPQPIMRGPGIQLEEAVSILEAYGL